MVQTELEKMQAVKEESQTIGAFLEWLKDTKGVQLYTYNSISDEMYPFQHTTNGLLAEYFSIDLQQVDREQKALLDQLRQKKG